MKIENCRDENTGRIYFWINNGKIILQHNDLVQYAFSKITRMLQNLENPRQEFIFLNNTESLNLLSILFISIETFLNDILKLFCFVKKENFSHYKIKSLNARIKAIFNLSETNREDFYKTGIYQELQEFEQLRNIIFHSSFEENLSFKKTMFSNIPINCNITDVMQAVKINIKVFEYFRFLIAGIDMMPNIFVTPLNNAFWEKCDIVYKKLFVPYFFEILKKHGFKTDLNLDYVIFTRQESIVIKRGELDIIVDTGIYRKELVYNTTLTCIGKSLYNKLAIGNQVAPDKFRFANYYR